MTVQEAYTVEMPAAAWRRVGGAPAALAAHFHTQLQRLAAEYNARPGRGCGVRALRAADHYVALVSIDHAMRRLTLAQVAHSRQGGCAGVW